MTYTGTIYNQYSHSEISFSDIFRYYLKYDKRCEENEIKTEESKYIDYIRSKMSDLNRTSRTTKGLILTIYD